MQDIIPIQPSQTLTPPQHVSDYDLITIVGPTASGKTSFAAKLAYLLDAEIISADSRQVYRHMDLGTGKDLDDYLVNGKTIPYHLIDIAAPGTHYNVYRYQQDFIDAYKDVRRHGHRVVLCGGSGLYIESVLRGYRLSPVPQNPELRAHLSGKSIEELTTILASYKHLHNTTDVDNPRRAIRAIEIEDYYAHTPIDNRPFPKLRSLTLGIAINRDLRRQRITQRLRQRLSNGMLDEIKKLLDSGVSADDLIYYGLEYKYLTLYVLNKISYDEMFRQLEIAIHQFAKRQMTWFRGMERRGTPIHWIALPPQSVADIPQFLRDNGLQALAKQFVR